MAFEKFTKTGRTFKPKASIWSRGQMGLNQGAVKRYGLDKFKYVVFYFDKEANQIGLKFTNDKDEDGANKINTKNTGAVFSGKAFLEFYGIEHSQTSRYDLKADTENGLFVIDLNEKL